MLFTEMNNSNDKSHTLPVYIAFAKILEDTCNDFSFV